MKIGLDFDRVLFDTDSFDEFYKEETNLYHVDADVRTEYGDYDPDKHAEACGLEAEDVYNVFQNDLSKFLYDDLDTLAKLRDKHDLIIVTRGKKKFQKAKIEASGVLDYVDGYRIVEGEDKDTADIDFLVDDRAEELNSVDIPGMVFDRDKHNLNDVVKKVET